ncbi:hypothetical protein PCASD_04215 [Puccinia coronata f. sp. avenae]|uniref:Protein CPL1-like domain-containing protein n=1 Tax=Puccinia coronata f. sp. avenae TaxID=200324 RepID=A0A2N5VEX4_9BASI|nr:hypothetical protein PCASD_04215 [Puccinia coronata f. sp. avenae]
MKLLIFALAAAVLPAIEAAANFKNTCNIVSNQMTTLRGSLNQLKATADRLGHTHISSKCSQASEHLGYAQSSWDGISQGYGYYPWRARSSSHASRVQSRMSSCGSIMDWIYGQPEIYGNSQYDVPVQNCKRRYHSCQTGCQQVWDWPSPPDYTPQPSQYAGYRRQIADTEEKLCPNIQETACPISVNASGHECIDTQTEITSCGGCESLNEGENCMAIEGADEVGCELGACRVFSALPGYEINEANGRPVPESISA